MEKKILNMREIGQMKRVCQNVDADFQKVQKINAKIAELQAERDELQLSIDEQEAPWIRRTGYRTTDLISKVIVPNLNADGTPKVDKDGRPTKTTKYVLKYPDTIVPPVEEDVVVEPTVEDVEAMDAIHEQVAEEFATL